MTIKPILFNTEMVRAILEGRKTVTRRLIKPQPSKTANMMYCYAGGPKSVIGKWRDVNDRSSDQRWTPPCHGDDILYVRETWTKLWYVDQDGYTHYDQPMYYYAADGTPDITLVDGDGFELDDQRIRWHPSIHMPKEATRIFLRVKCVSVERLQDISVEDAKKEGAFHSCGMCAHWHDYCGKSVTMARDCKIDGIAPEFPRLWDSTIKPADLPLYGWNANPWVWVIEYERCDKPAM